MESPTATFSLRSIGTVRSPYTSTREIPKGLGAEHHEEGTIEIDPQYETARRFC
jgi:tRNA (Thr-GGU) A37 N-methylase